MKWKLAISVAVMGVSVLGCTSAASTPSSCVQALSNAEELLNISNEMLDLWEAERASADVEKTKLVIRTNIDPKLSKTVADYNAHRDQCLKAS